MFVYLFADSDEELDSMVKGLPPWEERPPQPPPVPGRPGKLKQGGGIADQGVCMCVNVFMCVCVCVWVCVCVLWCMCVCVCVCWCICGGGGVCMCVCVWGRCMHVCVCVFMEDSWQHISKPGFNFGASFCTCDEYSPKSFGEKLYGAKVVLHVFR